MSATATAATTTAPVRATRPVRHTMRWLLRQHLQGLLWTTGILAVVVPSATATVNHYAEVDISIVQFARQAFIWFPFSMAIVTTTAFLNVHVAAGATRRVLSAASLLTGVVTGLAYALVMTGALQIERAVYGARGWTQQLTESAPVFEDTSQVGWMVTDLGLAFIAAQVSGLLVGLAYYRVGGWWGTLALPLTVGPLLVSMGLLTTDLLDPMSTLARVPIAAGIIALAALAYHLLLVRTQLKQIST
ncbi:hypothetical protein GXB85_10120 [Cellulomonas sp. APG4]|uniref:hypothetical protein n=1 Tax=Cellulomonas sp. APG4 TaxID=1538656 RepID=UPI0013793D7B|nr:hypothetical protein [Cellulomonas sp. APG4]NCT91304.1 hypothetical protein [Cellulomonas sp. APG4]